jgi:proteasome accessory factor A
VERRIFGIENEYGVTFTLRGQRRLSPDEVARYLFRRVVSWGRSSNVFLENGARLYLDVGSHPEYATPECDKISDVVVHDKAGEWILAQLVTGAQARLREEGIRGEVYLFKNNTDSVGNSYGCHENYLTERNDEFNRYTEVPGLPADLLGRRQGAPDGPGRRVLPQPAGRAHLGGGVFSHHPQPADHQHP